MPWPLLQIDAFTAEPFRGNPAAVCLLPEPRPEAWMQQVAAEMNLSETAFLVPRRDPRTDGFDLRWFTPSAEVALCGHATLASAHALWSEGRLGREDEARFHTLSGLLTARADGSWIELDFPALAASPAAPAHGLLAALGLEPEAVIATASSRFDLLVEVATPAQVAQLEPDFRQLAAVDVRGVIVTSRAAPADRDDGTEPDFVSRFFAPRVGVDEDPVTGSAHCVLAPYWQQRLGRNSLRARQLSRRGGDLRVQVVGERVKLAGQAVTVLRGELAG